MVEVKGCGVANFCEINKPNPEVVQNYNYSCIVCNQRDLCNSGDNYLQNSLLIVVSILAAVLVSDSFVNSII